MKEIESSTGWMAQLEKRIKENFVSYCATNTYSSENDERLFLDDKGEDCLKGWRIEQGKNSSLSRLFDIGAEAYSVLHAGVDPTEKNQSSFSELFSGYRDSVEILRQAIHQRVSTGSIKAVYPDGRPAEPGLILEAEEIEVIKFGRTAAITLCADDETMKQFYVELLCVGCLREIDHAIVALVHNPIDAIESTLNAKEMLDLARAGEVEKEIKQKFVIRRARRAAAGKHAKHTEPDKTLVRECWLEWQANPSLYKNKASFDRDMLEKMQKIEDIRTVTKWRLELQKEHTPC